MAQETLALSAALEDRIQFLGLEFLAQFLETAVERRPELTEALAELGHVYTQLGRHHEGLEVDRRLVRLHPENPTVHYNLACSLSLLGDDLAALAALEAAVGFGYDDADFMLLDEDLANVREHARFQELVRQIQRS